MKDYSKTFLKLSIIYLSIMFFLLSCEDDTYDYTPPEPPKTSVEEYLNHYSTISTPSYVWNDTLYRRRPIRWEYGGLKGTDSIDVFFHETFDNSIAKFKVISFLGVLDSIIEDENIKFNVVDNIDDADVTIVFGPDNYKEIFNNEPNYDYLGETSIVSEVHAGVVDGDITKIVAGSFWVRDYNDLLIKHELLHVLGFTHTNEDNSLMNHFVPRMDNLKDIDEKAIYLHYTNGLVTEVVAGGNGLPDWFFTNEEYEIHMYNAKIALENRFGL